MFKSTDFGSSWEVISPDLTTNDPEKLKPAGGPVWPENTTAEFHCTIISLSESPIQPGILWAGTDDGNLHVSVNGGETWKNVIDNVPKLPPFSSVSHVEPSSMSAGMAYCTFDRHMLDDFGPYVFKTTDFGRTWKNITGDLPENAYVWVLREDPKNPKVIYAGTELGLYVSFNRGNEWMKLHMKNLPTVAVHDILIHSKENDLILGTHGRSIWIFDDVSFLQEISSNVLKKLAYLFAVRPAMRHTSKPTRYGIGDKVFRGLNPSYGALITYYLKEKLDKKAEIKIEILDKSGKLIRELKNFPREAGLNRIAWDLRFEAARPRREHKAEEDFFGRGPRGPQVLPDIYSVRLTLENQVYEKPVKVQLDPTVNVSSDDLALQLEYTRRIRDMQSFVNDGLSALDMLKEQLEARKKTIKKQEERFPKEVIEAVDNHLKEIKSIQNMLARPEGSSRLNAEARLGERLRSLFGSIDRANASPTKAQVQYFDELEKEYKSDMAEANQYLGQTVKEINNELIKYQVPPLLIPDPIKFEIK